MNPIHLGITGSFGSGCGTASNYLKDKGFLQYSLTKKIHEELITRGIKNPRRNHFQDIGDELRRNNGNDYLARCVFEEMSKEWDVTKNIVIKSIRNHHEALFLKRSLKEFIIINIDAPKDIRFERNPGMYTSQEEFDEEDKRDMGDNENDNGQHIRKCVDLSDVVINNIESKAILFGKVERYLNLIATPAKYPPTDMEMCMAQAYFWSLKSTCLKRQVGAILVKRGHTIASGYNDTPKRTAIKDGKEIEIKISSCKFLEKCYRDDMKKCLINGCDQVIFSIQNVCEKCHKPIPDEKRGALRKHLDLCRAIHAEERAILQTTKFGGHSIEDSTLYTTTFPCLLCAKKIIESGISGVVYIEPYPYEEAARMLEKAEVALQKFEGVKSRLFDNFYGRGVF